MKLHLPKALLAAIAVVWSLHSAQAESLELGISGGVQTKTKNIEVNGSEYIGYTDGGDLYTNFTSGKVTESLTLAQTGKYLGMVDCYKTYYDLTINGTGKVAIGGKDSSGNYATLTAGVVTVNDNALLAASNAKLQTLTVNGEATVALHGGNQTNSDFSQGNSYLGNIDPIGLSVEAPKQTQVAVALNVNGGNLIMGTKANSASLSSQAHYVNGFGEKNAKYFGLGFDGQAATITQQGGNMEVYGDSIARGGLKIEQKGEAQSDMYFRDRLAFDGAGTNQIIQSNDNANLVLGRLVNESGAQTIEIKQSGAGYIQLAYGSEFKSNAKGTIKIEQSGGGLIEIGGGHKGNANVLNNKFASSNTTYSIEQKEQGGNIVLKGDADITTTTVTQSTGSAKLTLESGAKLTATSISTMGVVSNSGSIVTDTMTMTGGGLTVFKNGSLQSGELKLDGVQQISMYGGSSTTVDKLTVIPGTATSELGYEYTTESIIYVNGEGTQMQIGKEGVATEHLVNNAHIQVEDTSALKLYGTLKGDSNSIQQVGNATVYIDHLQGNDNSVKDFVTLGKVEGDNFTYTTTPKSSSAAEKKIELGSIVGNNANVSNRAGGIVLGSIETNSETSRTYVQATMKGDVLVDIINDKGHTTLTSSTGKVEVAGSVASADFYAFGNTGVTIGVALNVGTALLSSNGAITTNGGVADKLTLSGAAGNYNTMYGNTEVGELLVSGGRLQVKSTATLKADSITVNDASWFDGETETQALTANGSLNVRVNTLSVKDTMTVTNAGVNVNTKGNLEVAQLVLNNATQLSVDDGTLSAEKLTTTGGLNVAVSGAGSSLILGKEGSAAVHEVSGAWITVGEGAAFGVYGTLKGDNNQLNGSAYIERVEGDNFKYTGAPGGADKYFELGSLRGNNANLTNNAGGVTVGSIETSSEESHTYVRAYKSGDVIVESINDKGSTFLTASAGKVEVTGDVVSKALTISAGTDAKIGGTMAVKEATISATGSVELNGGSADVLNIAGSVLTLNTDKDLSIGSLLKLGNSYGMSFNFELGADVDGNGAIVMGNGADFAFAEELTEADISISFTDVVVQELVAATLNDQQTTFEFTLVSGLSDADVVELTAAITEEYISLNSLQYITLIQNIADPENNILTIQATELVVKDNRLVAVVSTETIPEPATATLSLLALAALSARRRRR